MRKPTTAEISKYIKTRKANLQKSFSLLDAVMVAIHNYDGAALPASSIPAFIMSAVPGTTCSSNGIHTAVTRNKVTVHVNVDKLLTGKDIARSRPSINARRLREMRDEYVSLCDITPEQIGLITDLWSTALQQLNDAYRMAQALGFGDLFITLTD